jgi:hypothetical protein
MSDSVNQSLTKGYSDVFNYRVDQIRVRRF